MVLQVQAPAVPNLGVVQVLATNDNKNVLHNSCCMMVQMSVSGIGTIVIIT